MLITPAAYAEETGDIVELARTGQIGLLACLVAPAWYDGQSKAEVMIFSAFPAAEDAFHREAALIAGKSTLCRVSFPDTKLRYGAVLCVARTPMHRTRPVNYVAFAACLAEVCSELPHDTLIGVPSDDDVLTTTEDRQIVRGILLSLVDRYHVRFVRVTPPTPDKGNA